MHVWKEKGQTDRSLISYLGVLSVFPRLVISTTPPSSNVHLHAEFCWHSFSVTKPKYETNITTNKVSFTCTIVKFYRLFLCNLFVMCSNWQIPHLVPKLISKMWFYRFKSLCKSDTNISFHFIFHSKKNSNLNHRRLIRLYIDI